MTNVRLSYDGGPLDLNLNFRSQGRTFSGFGTNAQADTYVWPYSQLDMQARLTLYRKTYLTFDARNITKTYRISTQGIEDSLTNALGAGRSYWVGVSFTY